MSDYEQGFDFSNSDGDLGAVFTSNPGELLVSAHGSAIRLTQTWRGIATYREADASRSPKEFSRDDKIPNVCCVTISCTSNTRIPFFPARFAFNSR